MIPRPRGTATSRARELRSQTRRAGEAAGATSNTPRMSSSLANNTLPDMCCKNTSRSPSLQGESVKPPVMLKENTFISRVEAALNNDTEAEIVPSVISVSAGGGDEEEAYTKKKSEFQYLKEDLEKRQTNVMEVYTYLKELHSKLVENGRDVDRVEPVRQLLDVGAGGGGEVTTPIGDGFELTKRISELPAPLVGLCHEVLAKRCAIVDYMKQTDLGGLQHIVSRVNEWGAEDDGLKTLLGTISKQTEKSATSIAHSVSELVQQAMNRDSKYIQFKDQNEKLKKQLENMENDLRQCQINAGTGSKTASKLGLGKQASQDSNKKGEADAREGVTKKNLECELRLYRSRIRDMERNLKDLQLGFNQKVVALQSIETTAKHQQEYHESRLHLLQENLRATENKISDQKDVYESRVRELVEALETTKVKGVDTSEEQAKKLAKLQQELEEEKLKNASNLRKLDEARINMEKMEKKARGILELVRVRSLSKQRCGDDLLKAEQDLKAAKEDNARLAEQCSQMVEAKERLETHMKSQELTIKELKSEVSALTAELNTSKEKLIQSNINENGNSSGYKQQLKTIANLRDKLASADQRNERLAAELDDKRLIIDQKEKAFNEQLKTLKVREELIKMLESKDSEQTQYNSFKEDEIAKANEFANAKMEEIKMLQLMVAKKEEKLASMVEIVKQMELNNQKCQRHRIKCEKTIEMLELELASSNKRYSETVADGFIPELRHEIPHLKSKQMIYARDECDKCVKPYFPCEGDPGASSAVVSLASSASEPSSRERPYLGNFLPFEPLPEADRSQIVTILRPYRRICLTPEMRLQPISSLISGFQNHSLVSTTEDTKTNDIFLLPSPDRRTYSKKYHF